MKNTNLTERLNYNVVIFSFTLFPFDAFDQYTNEFPLQIGVTNSLF